jgi:hypothetical protein
MRLARYNWCHGMAKISATSPGTALLYNASGANISHVTIGTIFDKNVTIAPLPLFATSLPQGSSTMSGISFPVPQASNFDVSISFDTGAKLAGSVYNISQASPAFYLIVFTNGLVVTNPTGRATEILFSGGVAMMAGVIEER